MENRILKSAIFVTCSLLAKQGFSAECLSPEALFGKIVATCGDQNIVYVGNETRNVLSVPTTTSHFEITYCNGGGRRGMHLVSHSEGFKLVLNEAEVLKYSSKDGKPELSQQITIEKAWGQFDMRILQSDGSESIVQCNRYNDTRQNIEYAY